MANIEAEKKAAGVYAADLIKSGNVVGLGTGSTARYAVERIAERIGKEKLDILGVPSSRSTKQLAEKMGILLTTLKEHPSVDIYIDGADEFDGEFNLIKGGGGAHTMEKTVATASIKFIVICDSTKKVEKLGDFGIPIEVKKEMSGEVIEKLKEMGGSPRIREGFVTDSGNRIIDLKIGIDDPLEMEDRLNSIPGVIDNGVFAHRRPEMVVMGTNNAVKIFKR